MTAEALDTIFANESLNSVEFLPFLGIVYIVVGSVAQLAAV